MDPLELLLECWFEGDVLVFLWTPGMIWPKKCPLWVVHSDTDPLLWAGFYRLLPCGLQTEPPVAPALAPSQRKSEILWFWMRVRNLSCKLCFYGSGDDFKLFRPCCVLLVRKGVGGGWRRPDAGCVRRGERMTLRTTVPHFEVVQSLGGFVLPWILFWNVTSRMVFSEEDTECFGWFNLTPHRFYKFFRFFDSCLTFWAPKCRQ